SGRIGNDEIGAWVKANRGKALAEEILVAPVRGRVTAVEQPRRRQQDRARAGRIYGRPIAIAVTDPFLHILMAPTHVVVRGQPQLRQDDYLWPPRCDQVDVGADRNAVAATERPE